MQATDIQVYESKQDLELKLKVPTGVTSQGMDQRNTYLSLQLALSEGHHLLIGHLGEKRSILVQAEAF